MAKTAEILEIPATITDRGQTTVPAAIRKMLALGKRDQVVFRGRADGTVVIVKKQARGGHCGRREEASAPRRRRSGDRHVPRIPGPRYGERAGPDSAGAEVAGH